MNENRNIELMLEILTPKIKKSIRETDIQHREDLEQELKVIMYKKLKEKENEVIPNFFDILEKRR